VPEISHGFVKRTSCPLGQPDSAQCSSSRRDTSGGVKTSTPEDRKYHPQRFVKRICVCDPAQADFVTECGSTWPKIAFVSRPRLVTNAQQAPSTMKWSRAREVFGIYKSKTTCKLWHLVGGGGRRVRAPRGGVGGADFGASETGGVRAGMMPRARNGPSQHSLYVLYSCLCMTVCHGMAPARPTLLLFS